jgi:hypothetical protein
VRAHQEDTVTDETSPTEGPAPTVPAAWQADPTGRFELRYWDGTAWTDHVSTKGVQQTDPVMGDPAATPAAPPAGGPMSPTPAAAPPAAVTVPRAKVVWPTRTKVVVLGGAVLLLVGSVLPWAKAEATVVGQTLSSTTNGLDGDGVITLILALVAGLVFLFVPRAKVVGSLVLVAGAIAGLVAIIDIADVSNKADDLKQLTKQSSASVGIGLWMAAVAAIVLIVGGVLCLVQRDGEPVAPTTGPPVNPPVNPAAPPAT